jgi:hypothetical protein
MFENQVRAEGYDISKVLSMPVRVNSVEALLRLLD